MSEIKVRLGQQSSTVVALGQQPSVKVISSLVGTVKNMSDLADVNAPSLTNGMILVYNSDTNKWDATLSLTPGETQNLDINGGNF